jgi:ankyrin repeat protein
MAAQEGDLEAVQCLVKELGANVNLGDETGCTPLFAAAQKGHIFVVRLMTSVRRAP